MITVISRSYSTAGVLKLAARDGIASANTESASNMLSWRAATTLKDWRPNLRPPTTKAIPITSKMLAMTEPTIVALAIS